MSFLFLRQHHYSNLVASLVELLHEVADVLRSEGVENVHIVAMAVEAVEHVA